MKYMMLVYGDGPVPEKVDAAGAQHVASVTIDDEAALLAERGISELYARRLARTLWKYILEKKS